MSPLSFLYPPRCLSCSIDIVSDVRFCDSCLSLLVLLAPQGHCDKCFGSISTPSGTCRPCREKKHLLRKLGACFEAFGPAQKMLQVFLRSQSHHLAKEIASFVVVQLESLHFPSFDAVTMVPNYFSNPQFAIASEVAAYLGIPFLKTLSRQVHREPVFFLKRHCNLIDKRILLLHTQAKTRQTMRSAASALALGWPQVLYGMTFCAS